MKPGLFITLAAACCLANASAPAAAPAGIVSAPSAAATASAAPGTDSAEAGTAAPPPAGAVASPAPAVTAPISLPGLTTMPAAPVPAAPMPAPASAVGNLLQTILALTFVLALLGGLAWFMKRYGPKAAGGNARLRLLSSLSLGGRERIMLIEVGEQWIVVGASPGRVNALATMPRQDDETTATLAQQDGPAAANFSEWLKQTIEKRNGK